MFSGTFVPSGHGAGGKEPITPADPQRCTSLVLFQMIRGRETSHNMLPLLLNSGSTDTDTCRFKSLGKSLTFGKLEH